LVEETKRDHRLIMLDILKDSEHRVGCEVGVYTGTMVGFLLKELPKIERYYTVDPWMSYEQYDGKKYRRPGHKVVSSWEQAMLMYFRNIEPFQHKVITLRMKSTEAVKHVLDKSLDWVYIDANHKYEYVKENLQVWTPKVKPGGIVSGHDYDNPKGYGKGWNVKKAVDEFVPKSLLSVEGLVWWFKKPVNGD